jgi:hypothetical protein
MAEFREIELIVVKRQHISLNSLTDDKYGHWWFEIGNARTRESESYGWWPKYPVNLSKILRGTAGELNGRTSHGGTETQDPHHGDHVEEMFHPIVPLDDKRDDRMIADCLRDFAKSYSGEWRWTLGWGQNCHTFQQAAFEHCQLSEPVRLKKGIA